MQHRAEPSIQAAIAAIALLLLACAPASLFAQEAAYEPAEDEQDRYLLHDMHLPDGTMQIRAGLGQRFADGFANRALASELGPLRWGVTDRVNWAFPLMLSYMTLDRPTQRFVVVGGFQGFESAPGDEFYTRMTLGGAYAYLPQPNTVWTLAAGTSYLRHSGAGGDGLPVSVSVTRAQTFGDRWILAGGMSLNNATNATAQFDDDVPSLTLGSTGAFRRPLVQLRVWRGLHLYASSTLTLVIHEPVGDTHQHVAHKHLGGFNWYF